MSLINTIIWYGVNLNAKQRSTEIAMKLLQVNEYNILENVYFDQVIRTDRVDRTFSSLAFVVCVL